MNPEHTNNPRTNEYPCSIYKYTFEMLENNLFGMGYIMFNFEDKHIQERGVVLYESPNECTLNLQMPWREFVEAANLESEKSTHKNEVRDDILANIEKGITYTDIIHIERHIHESQTNRITDMLKPIMGRVLFDKELIMHSYSELIPRSEFELHIQSNARPEPSPNELDTEAPTETDPSQSQGASSPHSEDTSSGFFKVNKDAVLLACYPVLAPISGTPVFNLKTGDKIMVRIVDEKQAPKVNQALGSEADALATPVPATIKKIQLKDKSFQILIHIKNEYYGRITESEQIKIKKAFPSAPEHKPLDTDMAEEPTKAQPLKPLVLGIALTLMVIGLIILIVMNS